MQQSARRHAARDHILGTQPQDQGNTPEHHDNDHGRHDGAGPHTDQADPEGLLYRLGKAGNGALLATKGLDRLDGIDAFTGKADGIGEGVLRTHRQLAHLTAKDKQGHDQDGHDQQDHGRQLGADEEQKNRRADQGQEISQGIADRRRQQGVDQLDVGR